MAYLDHCTPEQRALFTAPSRHLLQFQAFTAVYRKDHPAASLDEVQHAYQTGGWKLP